MTVDIFKQVRSEPQDGLTAKIVQARKILSDAVAEHRPREIFAMFSGGYDSLVIAHLVWRFSVNTGCAHLDTGIAIKETGIYVRDTCADRQWNLVEYKTPENYDDLVLEWGFPGPAHHFKMYCRLKDRSVEALVREHKSRHRDRIMLVSGIRKEESKKRQKLTKIVQRRGAQVWVNPLFYWTKFDVHAYKARYDLPDSWVVQTLHMSGDCLCGANAHKGELAEVRLWYPEMGKRIDDLAIRVKAAGHEWGWEDAPAQKPDPRQGTFFMPLCVGCENNTQIGATN